MAAASAAAALLLERSRQRAVDAVVQPALAVETGEPVIDVGDEADVGMHGHHLADDGGAAAAAAEHEREAPIHGGRGYRSRGGGRLLALNHCESRPCLELVSE